MTNLAQRLVRLMGQMVGTERAVADHHVAGRGGPGQQGLLGDHPPPSVPDRATVDVVAALDEHPVVLDPEQRRAVGVERRAGAFKDARNHRPGVETADHVDRGLERPPHTDPRGSS